jgi:hypothetical protein
MFLFSWSYSVILREFGDNKADKGRKHFTKWLCVHCADILTHALHSHSPASLPQMKDVIKVLGYVTGIQMGPHERYTWLEYNDAID